MKKIFRRVVTNWKTTVVGATTLGINIATLIFGVDIPADTQATILSGVNILGAVALGLAKD